jgi:hypothetical protein
MDEENERRGQRDAPESCPPDRDLPNLPARAEGNSAWDRAGPI